MKIVMKQTLDVTARKETLEEAARRELNSSYAIVVDGEFAYPHAAMLNMFRKGAQWKTNHPWTSVEDERPKEKERVLAHFFYYYKYADREAESRSHTDIFTYEKGVWTNDDDDVYKGKEVSRDDIRITHWMPIPKLEEE